MKINESKLRELVRKLIRESDEDKKKEEWEKYNRIYKEEVPISEKTERIDFYKNEGKELWDKYGGRRYYYLMASKLSEAPWGRRFENLRPDHFNIAKRTRLECYSDWSDQDFIDVIIAIDGESLFEKYCAVISPELRKEYNLKIINQNRLRRKNRREKRREEKTS